jgi:DNA mismatch repair protein MutS2
MSAEAAMDAHTLELLEFDKVRELLAGYAASSLGKELARELKPSTDVEEIRAQLALVTEMVDAIGVGQSPPFGGLHDVRLTVRRAVIGAALTAEQLLEVAETLNCTAAMYRYRMRLDQRCQRLIELLTPIEDHGLVAKSIAGCIDSRGHVLDMASPELGKVRRQLAELDDRVQSEIKRLLRDPRLREILRYPNATVSGDHYVLPVAVNHRQKLAGVVHRTSSTGETVFIEPASVSKLSAERVVLKGEEDREVRRVLRRLTAEVARVARPLSFALDIMAKLDLVTTKARYSLDYHSFPPDLNTEGQLWLRCARHPLLEHLFRQPPPQSAAPSPESNEPAEPRKVMPIDVRLGDTFNLLVITGPNTGGKTVALKTTGLLSLMAQCGMHIPAGEGSRVPIFHQILADIGDEQSLEQSLSTFSSHISRIAGILEQATDKSLILLDELGAGTDPTEGAALGRAILDEIDQIGCRAMVTTHLGDLKTYAFGNQRAENAAVEFSIETLRPTYRLLIGQYGMSNAIRIARRLKLPRELVRRAQRYLRRKQKRAPEMERLQALKAEAEKAREEALRVQHEAEQQKEAYSKKVEEVAREAEKAEELRQFRLKLQANDRVRVARFDQPGRIVRIDFRKNVAVASVGLGQWEVPLDEVFPLE